MADLAALTAAIEAGDRASAVRITREAVEEGLDPRTVLAAMTAVDTIIAGRMDKANIWAVNAEQEYHEEK